MLNNFNTNDKQRADAALILYSIYRSRNANSSLNGLETWDRLKSYIRGSCLKSTNTAEFVEHLCKMSKVDSIKPRYLKSDDGLVEMPDGSLISSENVKNYQIDLFENDSLLEIFENEGILLSMLVRERIQREKMMYQEDNENETED